MLDFRFSYDQVLMWPYVRHLVLQTAMNEMIGLEQWCASSEKRTARQLTTYALETVLKNPLALGRQERFDILMFGCASSVSMIKESDGRYVNRWCDRFASAYADRTLIVEDSCRLRYFAPRAYTQVRYHDLFRYLTLYDARFKPTLREDKSTIDDLILFLKKNFIHSFRSDPWDLIRRSLNNYARRVPGWHQLYRRLFTHIHPQIVFVEDGSYGPKSHIIKWARDLGIRTAEFQHGAISRNHPAYNFGRGIFGSDYEKYLPEFLLTYGEFWSSIITTPSRKISMGNPFLEEKLDRENKNGVRKDLYTLLIASSGTTPELLRELVLKLLKVLPPEQYKLIFRPNPAEAPWTHARYGDLEKMGVEFDRGSFYQTLSRVDGIVTSEYSTVNFEALAFQKDVFIRKNLVFDYYADTDLFDSFETAEELYQLLLNRKGTGRDRERFFASAWEKNYREFIDREIYGGR